MRTALLGGIVVLAVGVAVVGWRLAQTRGPRQADNLRAPQETSAPQAKPAQQSAGQPAVQPPGASPSAAQGKETEQRLGPFWISGSEYTVALRNRKRQPGSTQEEGDTVVAMEIRDAAGDILYQRKFPYQEANDSFSDAWSVDAHTLAGTNGKGLLVSYSFDSEPSAPQESQPDWWQAFGVVDGKLKPFGAPVYFEGQLGWEAAAKTGVFKSAGPLGAHADELQFRIWTGHFRMIYPVRVDWAEGTLTPVQPCTAPVPTRDLASATPQSDADAQSFGVTAVGIQSSPCEYKVLPANERQVRDTTFVTLCSRPAANCSDAKKVVVKSNSEVVLLTARANAPWNPGIASGPSSIVKSPGDAMNDSGGVGLDHGSDIWLKVRIDGKEGWMHGEEDFAAFGFPEDE